MKIWLLQPHILQSSLQEVENKGDERYIVNGRNNLCCWIKDILTCYSTQRNVRRAKATVTLQYDSTKEIFVSPAEMKDVCVRVAHQFSTELDILDRAKSAKAANFVWKEVRS